MSLLKDMKENLSIFTVGPGAPHKKSKSGELNVSVMSISQNPLIVKVGMTKFVQHGRNMKRCQTSCIQNLVASNTRNILPLFINCRVESYCMLTTKLDKLVIKKSTPS